MTTAKPLSQLPGPKGLPFLGVLSDFRRDAPWLVCERYTRQYGPLARFKLLGKQAVVVADPAAIRQIMSQQSEAFYKKRPVEALKVFSPEDMFVSPGGEDWRQRRASHPAMNPAFAGVLEASAARCARQTTASLTGLPASFDASELLMRLGFDLLCIVAYGRALDDEAYKGLQWLTRAANARMQREATSPFKLPPLNEAQRAEEAASLASFARAYDACTEPQCLVAELKARGLDSATGSRFLSGFFLGGAVSTPAALINALYHVAQTPGLAAELRRRLQADDPKAEALASYLPLESVLRESLRVSSPVPLFLRHVATPTEVGGYLLPAGVGLFLSIWTMQRDPTHWADADQFLPARWDRATVEANPIGSSWFAPFGWGPRACVGAEIALVAARNALAVILRDGLLAMDEGQPGVPKLFLGVRLLRGLRGHPAA